MEKPIIAVLGGHHSAGHDQYDCVDHVYCERIVEAGALPILLPAAEDDTGLAQLLRLCSGMLLPGGADVDPRFYHQEPLPQLGALDSALGSPRCAWRRVWGCRCLAFVAAHS